MIALQIIVQIANEVPNGFKMLLQREKTLLEFNVIGSLVTC